MDADRVNRTVLCLYACPVHKASGIITILNKKMLRFMHDHTELTFDSCKRDGLIYHQRNRRLKGSTPSLDV